MAYILETTGTENKVVLKNFGITLTHPTSKPISKILDVKNPHDLVMYNDVQKAINDGKIVIKDGNKELKYINQRNQILKINEDLIFSKQIVTLTASGLLTDNSYDFNFNGLNLNSNLGLCYDIPWQIISVNFLIGTPPVGGDLRVRTFIDNVNSGNIVVPENANKHSFTPNSDYLVGANEVFNLRTITSNNSEDVIINIKIKFLSEIL